MMNGLTNDEWIKTNYKPLRHPKNKEFVTGRVNIINKKKVIRISIGLIVCDLLEFKKGDRINLFINKKERNFILIKKSKVIHDGYLLNCNGKNPSFMTFDFRYETAESFRLSQTVILNYEINEDQLLLINIESLRWNY